MPVLYRHLDDLPERFRGGVVSIGNFDGVHWGHARIVGRLLDMARRQDVRAVILTFDPHPARLLRPLQAPTPLSWTEHKARLLHGLGVDAVVAYPTDAALLGLTAGEFFDRIVLGRLRAARDGRRAKLLLRPRPRRQHRGPGRFCRQSGIPLEVVEPVQIDGQVVSSSRVRDLDFRRSRSRRPPACSPGPTGFAARWSMARAAETGSDIRPPTSAEIDTLLPGEGIYAGQAWIDGRSYATAMSLGSNPTFDEVGKEGRGIPLGLPRRPLRPAD